MDALDALSTERPILSTRLRRHPSLGSVESPSDAARRAETLVSQLPMLVRGSWSPAVSPDSDDALLRLQAAMWEVAARRVTVVPPATEAARLLTGLLARPTTDLTVLRAAARLTAYLELRARFG